jgi:hypothetical protein
LESERSHSNLQHDCSAKCMTCLVLVLLLLHSIAGKQLPTSVAVFRTYPKWEEQSWRRHGIMSPPVNPWLKEEQRATEFSHLKRWQQGSQNGTSDSSE